MFDKTSFLEQEHIKLKELNEELLKYKTNNLQYIKTKKKIKFLGTYIINNKTYLYHCSLCNDEYFLYLDENKRRLIKIIYNTENEKFNLILLKYKEVVIRGYLHKNSYVEILNSKYTYVNDKYLEDLFYTLFSNKVSSIV